MVGYRGPGTVKCRTGHESCLVNTKQGSSLLNLRFHVWFGALFHSRRFRLLNCSSTVMKAQHDVISFDYRQCTAVCRTLQIWLLFVPSFSVSDASFVEAGRNPTQSGQLPQGFRYLLLIRPVPLWNGWQASHGIGGRLGLESANPPPWSSPNLTPETFCLAFLKALKYDHFY